MEVFLLWHIHTLNDEEENSKLIGVYSSNESAEGAMKRAKLLPGFREAPDGFLIDRYVVDQDNWTSGYVTIND
jgi:hypothetical protein